MCNFKVGDTVKLVSKNSNTALKIGDIGTITIFDNQGTCRVNTDKITSGNWTKLSDLELVKRENTMTEINIKVPDGYVIDEYNSSFTCIKFKKEEKKEVNCWKDLYLIEGYYIDNDSDVQKLGSHVPTHTLRNLFATKEQAEACIALAMLSQLMKDVNGDWKPDWTKETNKYVINFYNEMIRTDFWKSTQNFLSFPTEEIRDTFLNNHRELIIKAKPLL